MKRAQLIAGLILGPVSLWAFYSGRAPSGLAFLLLVISCRLAVTSVAAQSDTLTADDIGSRPISSLSAIQIVSYVGRGYFLPLGVPLVVAGVWKFFCFWFPRMSDRIPKSNQESASAIFALGLLWLWNAVTSVLKHAQQRKKRILGDDAGQVMITDASD
jgi:hypothetical protein